MNDINVLISNGTCYYEIGLQSSENVIPCGNAANDVYPCCQAGDFCLEYNVCYNENYTTTYIAGCTDPEFGRNCPVKDHSDQQLLGLVQCSDTDTSDGEVLWSGCPGPATRTALGQPSVCACSGTADGLLYAPTSLSAVASLPTRIGETISFADGHTPGRVTVASIPVTTSVDGLRTTMPIATSLPTLDPPSGTSGPQDLSAGAKAGIGVGAAALGLAALGLVLWSATWYRRRRSQKSEAQASSDHPTAPDQDGLAISPTQQANSGYYYPSEAGSTTGSVPPSYNSPAWLGYSGFKSELPADSERGVRSELPAGDLLTESAVEREEAFDPPQQQPPSAPESPAPYSTRGTLVSVSDISSIISASPTTQSGQWQGNVSPPGGVRGLERAQMTPISELHG